MRTLKPLSQRDGAQIVVDGVSYLDFSSNDYLGLSQHPQLVKASQNAIGQYGMGATGSRLLSGDYTYFHDFESELAAFKEKDAALLFNSGYQLNVGLFSQLVDRQDIVFADKFIHASLIDGIRLSGAKLYRFSHQSMADLERLLTSFRGNYRRAWIVSESVFSMHGDTTSIAELVRLKREHQAQLLIDDAHALGVLGPQGRGLTSEFSDDIDIIVGTFGKAFGCSGAFLACDGPMKQRLVSTCRSFIYSTALPFAVVAWNREALKLVQTMDHARADLMALASTFREKLQAANFEVDGDTMIVPVVVGEDEKAVAYSEALKRKGFWVLPIRTPTVASGDARLRFSLTSLHSLEQLQTESLKT